MRTSGHFCPYPHVYQAVFRSLRPDYLVPTKTVPGKGRWSTRASVDPLRRIPGSSRRQGARPKETGTQRGACEQTVPCVSAWRLGQELSYEIPCHYFDAVSLGD